MKKTNSTTHGVVSAPQPEAVEAGILAFQQGGNAVDAAIACALVQTAVDPQMCGIAGFGCMHLYMPSQAKHLCLDFHSRAPAKATATMWQHLIEKETEDGFGFVLKDGVNDLGYGAITTPMTLKAFDDALQRFGTMSLGSLLEPAIDYAEHGFMVRPHVSYFWNLVENAGRIPHIKRLTENKAARKIYTKGQGEIYQTGEILKNPDLANTYGQIAQEGIGAFYQGSIAEIIERDMREHGGLLTKEDLQNVAVTENSPLWGTYKDYRIATNQPPGGGVMILEMLNILENFDLVGMGHNSADYIATVSEAMKIATVDKDLHVGDPNFVNVPLDDLTSKSYAKSQAEAIQQGEKKHVPRMQAGQESKDTTHVCTADEFGNCVTLTHTLGMPSGVVTEGLGFMYNGAMSVFDPRPGRTGSIAPGKSRFSAMCPTMVFAGDEIKLLAGAPGGTYITMGVLQCLLNVLEFGMDAQQAVAAPRFCTTSNTIDVTNRIPRFVEKELKQRGYPVRRSPLSYHFAGVHAISFDGQGNWCGGADPGRDGVAMSV